MKKLSRVEMKDVMGGYNPVPPNGCANNGNLCAARNRDPEGYIGAACCDPYSTCMPIGNTNNGVCQPT